jgi:hypothetical protein
MTMNLIVLANNYSIYRFNKDDILPEWVYASDFYSITRTKDELSVVTLRARLITENIVCNNDWRILKFAGPLDFSLIGIIADISKIFKDHKISICTISTFDTDYILIRENNLEAGIKALKENGYLISFEGES